MAIGLVPLLMFGSITFGLRLAPLGYPPGVFFPAPLDYSRGPLSAFPVLRDLFIERVLGRAIREQSVTSAGTGSTSTAGGASRHASSRPMDVPPTVVSHPLTNATFAEAYEVSAVPFTAKTDTGGAGREAGEPSDCTPVGGTVWYRYAAPSDVGLVADTYGTDRAVTLAVLRGTDLRNLELVGCATHPRGNAHVPFSVVQGETYYAQITSVSGGALVFNLRFRGFTTRIHSEDSGALANFGGPSPDGKYLLATEHGDCESRILHSRPEVCPQQVFVYGVDTGRKVIVSVSSKGEPGNDHSITNSSMTPDGRFVTFYSAADNLVDDDTNTCRLFQRPGQCLDVFVHDRDADGNGIFDETYPGARKTVRVSVSSDGEQGNHHVGPSYISWDGRYVVFQSWADNLVEGDTNGVTDVFVHDRDANENGIFDETHPGARRTFRVTVTSDGEQLPDHRSREFPLDRGHHLIGVSSNARYVLFRSAASNLVTGEHNGAYNVFVRDVAAGTTTQVNVSSAGEPADRGTRLPNSFYWKVSDDGRFAIFHSDATNLVPDDTNDTEDLFLRDLVRGTTQRLTVTSDGRQPPPGEGEGPTVGQDLAIGGVYTAGSAVLFEDIYTLSELNANMTPDGRYVFFSSGAKLVPEDQNGQRDIYVRDLHRGTLTLVSVSTSGEQANASSNIPIPTADGRMLSFMSASSNLDGEPSGPVPGVWGPFLRVLPGGP